ncbi:TonB-dependent receptor domain-containing protein [Sphingomonas sp. LY160]|uniref:TonB-dependent receptor domain-containing protein n=1 Tax=Sphingomonas sp. LY160 TaxID=3095342 RepID=UPI002ADEC778|nr:TonB-dependent receptor [Sphingomonas sp. LY160]MEA1071245.1 TonB-dependent receptor [Sphingomonas sp. LY160]
MKKEFLLGATALFGTMAIAQPAFAQDTTGDTDPPATLTTEVEIQSGENDPCLTDPNAQNCQAVVVTGSRIRRPNLESTVPITSIGGETFFQQGQTNVGDTLNDLPQLRSTFAQQNPGLGIGIAGLNLLDLRGLGTQRTLVLVNGRRHVAADILNNAVSPDINTIPNDLIERVDIVTGGNSAIYGSDAIAGVVNFVLRRDYEGLQLRGQAGIAEEGFGGNQYVSAMYGKNFADGRGNVTLHGEYARADRVFASDVPAFRSNDNFGVVDSDGGAGIVNGGDGFPDRAFFRGLGSTTIDYRGLIPINQRSNDPATPGFESGACGNATTPNNGGTNSLGAPFSCTYIFTGDGRLTQQTGARFGTGINSGIVGTNGQSGREGKTVSVLPFTERYNFNILSQFEFSQAAEVFFEGKWNRVNALGNNAGPSFVQGTGGTVDFRERQRLDNPFLNPADRITLANLISASGCRSDLQVTCPAAGNLTATDRANIANGSYRFVIARNLLDVGLRDEKFQRDTYRFVGGLRGTFNTDWSYEISANYGKFKEDISASGYIDRQRFALALDAGRNPVTGQIQCRSQFDPAAAVKLVGFGPGDPTAQAAYQAAQSARLAADIAACVPYNPFGSADNSASVAYFGRTFTAKSSLDQLVLSGFMSGDSSQLFELPGGPISFALGAEYRRENASYEQDPFTTDGFSNGVSIPAFKPDAFKVKEAFGELRIPIIKDVPLFHELTLSGAGRVAKYQGSVGRVFSYNAGVDYAPFRDLRFRANYSRAVRAPNVSETGFPLVPNFSNGFVDPCNPTARAGNPVRAANCAADLGPLLANLTDATQSLPIVSGSNPALDVEKSDSYTVGGVFQPRFIPGMSLSVDYYDITVKGIIATVAPQTIVNQCYDSASLNNIFCGQFERYRGTGPGPLGEVPGRILGNSLINAPLNFAERKRRGIDVNFAYRRDFGPIDFNTNLIYTHNFEISNFQDPTNPDFETRVLGQLGDPEDEFRWDFDFGLGPVTLGYRARYIGPMYFNTYASLFEINGLPATDVDAFPDRKFKAVSYHDLRADFDIAKDGRGNAYKFYVGVDNVFDKGVPKGATTATGAGSAIYSFRGRSYYAGFRARF